MKDIVISGAREGNLKSISLRIPREKLVVLTGVSGSGKSTLLIDVLFNECQRQYLEAMDLQGIRKPQVESIRGVSPAVCITQRGRIETHVPLWALSQHLYGTAHAVRKAGGTQLSALRSCHLRGGLL
ncbi:MAG: ATP-binding cassette domain-containing protein [Ruthenibacterium lactatiformans]